jgi:hypothetical protein
MSCKPALPSVDAHYLARLHICLPFGNASSLTLLLQLQTSQPIWQLLQVLLLLLLLLAGLVSVLLLLLLPKNLHGMLRWLLLLHDRGDNIAYRTVQHKAAVHTTQQWDAAPCGSIQQTSRTGQPHTWHSGRQRRIVRCASQQLTKGTGSSR